MRSMVEGAPRAPWRGRCGTDRSGAAAFAPLPCAFLPPPPPSAVPLPRFAGEEPRVDDPARRIGRRRPRGIEVKAGEGTPAPLGAMLEAGDRAIPTRASGGGGPCEGWWRGQPRAPWRERCGTDRSAAAAL